MNDIDELIDGAIDAHVHAAPDPLRQRRLDALNLAIKAKDMGMRAIVIKSHHYSTAPVASIVNQVVPDFLLIGSLVLNWEVGGLNPVAVEVAAKTGARIIWMPTLASVIDTKKRMAATHYPLTTSVRYPNKGISLTSPDGKILPETMTILEIIKDYNIVLATGHISESEIYTLAIHAKSMKVNIVVSHPLTTGAGSPLTIKQQQELVNEGAYIEHCFNACLPPELATSAKEMVEHIKAVGVENCILSTDLGQYYNPTPPEGFRMMLANMLMEGLSAKELEILIKKNPAKLLGLD